MSSHDEKRDYRLTGPENKRAQERGLVGAEWYTCPISRERLKQLSERKDGPAIRDTLIAIVVLLGTGTLAFLSWGTWWAIPAFAVYGVIYASIGDSRWHECSHGTAFKTRWMNEVVFQAAGFLILRQATPWKFSHIRHHRETIIVGRDPEIPLQPKPVPRPLLMEIVHLIGSTRELKRLALHCMGKLDGEEKEYIPSSQVRKVSWEARTYALIFLTVAGCCLCTGSLLPAMLIGLPSFYGVILVLTLSVMQHVGLPEDVLDHRLNSRTVYMNPIVRFLYWNINYHMDHHMFPSVPYHALPALHEEIKHDCPPANPSIWSGLKEVRMILARRRHDPSYVYIRPLPDTARPYRYDVLHSRGASKRNIRSASTSD
ncbi:MAG: fatty acid desaturase [Paenibacillaceae bacterium]|nr:fatty acid desaturase [Paenibacillaceae bacterium]